MPGEHGINQDLWPTASFGSLGNRMARGASGKHRVFMNMAEHRTHGRRSDSRDGKGPNNEE